MSVKGEKQYCWMFVLISINCLFDGACFIIIVILFGLQLGVGSIIRV